MISPTGGRGRGPFRQTRLRGWRRAVAARDPAASSSSLRRSDGKL